ncbi:MAG: dTMP kinase [Gemmatimonadetes bacterium]|nr:dTMP kinase [Gemmatimonadota bacterium]
MSGERGVFVTFEGGEGSGKSTQVSLLGPWLRERGVPVLSARDPGSTPLGEAVRRLLLDARAAPVAPQSELLLYAAARAQLVHEIVQPALGAGRVVLLDRYEDSTYAYQGAGRGLGEEAVSRANEVATGGLRPDLVVLLDVTPDEGLRRRWAAVGSAGGDRMEREEEGFHQRVRAAYLARADAEPARFLLLDGRRAADTIHHEVRARVLALVQREMPQGCE